MKMRNVAQRARQARLISPAQCGGLIEETAIAPSRTKPAWISPAQCGGLIEDDGIEELALLAQTDFPRAMRGPH